jgi:hypothetical protein
MAADGAARADVAQIQLHVAAWQPSVCATHRQGCRHRIDMVRSIAVFRTCRIAESLRLGAARPIQDDSSAVLLDVLHALSAAGWHGKANVDRSAVLVALSPRSASRRMIWWRFVPAHDRSCCVQCC